MDNTLRMIGLALRAGRLEAGEEPVGQACREKDCRLILAAADAAGGSLRRVQRFAEEGACLWLTLPYTKEELGGALGRGTCAMAAVTDLGLAEGIVQKLAAQDPERYSETAQRLQITAQRAARRREQAGKKRQDGRRPVKKHGKG